MDKTNSLCPRCLKNNIGRTPGDPGALSRADNETYICSDCGVEEAFLNFAGHKAQPVSLWPIRESVNL